MLHCVKLSVAWKSDEKALYTVKAQNLDHQLVIMDDRLNNSNYQTQIMLPHITVYHYWTAFKGSFLEGGGRVEGGGKNPQYFGHRLQNNKAFSLIHLNHFANVVYSSLFCILYCYYVCSEFEFEVFWTRLKILWKYQTILFVRTKLSLCNPT